jgi:hypothetical protein
VIASARFIFLEIFVYHKIIDFYDQLSESSHSDALVRCNISQSVAYIRVPASESDFSSSVSSSGRAIPARITSQDQSDPAFMFAPHSQIMVSNLKLLATTSSTPLLLASSSSNFRLMMMNRVTPAVDSEVIEQTPKSLSHIAVNTGRLPQEFDVSLRILYWDIDCATENCEQILLYCTDKNESLTCIFKYPCPSPSDMVPKLGWLFAGSKITVLNLLVKFYDSNFGIVHAVRSDSTEVTWHGAAAAQRVGTKRRLSGSDTIQEVAQEEALFALCENFRSRFTAIRSSQEVYCLYPHDILRGCEMRILRDLSIRAPQSPLVQNGSKIMIAETGDGERLLCLVDSQLSAALSSTASGPHTARAFAVCLETLSEDAAAETYDWSLSSAYGAIMHGGSTGLNSRLKINSTTPMILRLLSVENV